MIRLIVFSTFPCAFYVASATPDSEEVHRKPSDGHSADRTKAFTPDAIWKWVHSRVLSISNDDAMLLCYRPMDQLSLVSSGTKTLGRISSKNKMMANTGSADQSHSGGPWGSISRVFARASKQRKTLDLSIYQGLNKR